MPCSTNENLCVSPRIFTTLAIVLALLGILALAGCDIPRDSGGGSGYGGSSGGGGHSHH
jgi:hypothetical protein